jgi:RHH-type proline utilization regulon transcriptional repressor/proline dehydrogenase/delta 1-pyrroline-5-carboxylate dehydrogenase
MYNTTIPIESVAQDPLTITEEIQARHEPYQHPKIPLPRKMLLPTRLNSEGLDLGDQAVLHDLETTLKAYPDQFPLSLSSLIARQSSTEASSHDTLDLYDPGYGECLVSTLQLANQEEMLQALTSAELAFSRWTMTPVQDRARLLDTLANLMEQERSTLLSLLVYEGGKVITDALAEVRESVDFCRYYAEEARKHMTHPSPLPGPTGEMNALSLGGRGIFVCISPWNFPLAIFMGQVAAALVTGNCVIAKPAQQTPAIAHFVVQLAHCAGIPRDVLQLILAKGSLVGDILLTDPRVSGVAFTGSTEVAWTINQTLASRRCPIAPLIAETGGINAMIVDSSALPEQVVRDVIISAFQSAGQRCSALRLLFLQEDIADKTLAMLKGAMAELTIGHPSELSTDVGPIIDEQSHKSLLAYRDSLAKYAEFLGEVPMEKRYPPQMKSQDLIITKSAECTTVHEHFECISKPGSSFGNSIEQSGHYFAPQAWILKDARDLDREIFGPILHIVRFKGDELHQVVDTINAKGYGLTLGLHSRIDETIAYVRQHARVGNLYVNRSIIGAVVSVQPFGGEGLSGTGPKAGGPHYLRRFMVERTFTQDTTAAGGNASLLASM